MSGWIKLYRSLLDWEWYKDKNVYRLFTHLLLKANYEDKSYKGLLIKRGQILTSRSVLSKETGLTEQEIRTSLNKLKSTNNILVEANKDCTIITILNFDMYQPHDEKSTNKSTTTKEESRNNNLNNIYNTPLYPPKEEKTEPLKKYVFEGHVVKLIEQDFTKWKQAYPLVDLRLLLANFDDWVKDQGEEVRKNWFMRCSNYLAKKNQQLEERAKQPLPTSKPAPKTHEPQKEETIWDIYDRLGIEYDHSKRI